MRLKGVVDYDVRWLIRTVVIVSRHGGENGINLANGLLENDYYMYERVGTFPFKIVDIFS